MVKIPQPRRVALLIDADNAQLSHTAKILNVSASYGLLTICHAYGDWKQLPLSSWREKILSHNINLIQQDHVVKNATDLRIFIDVCEYLAFNAADIFIVVSGDGHFTLLCEHIKRKGKDVIVIGSKKHTSKALRKSCKNFSYIEDL